MRKHKYNAKPTEVDGVKFDSKAEARRYCELKLLARAGEITQLELKPVYPIIIDGVQIKMRNGHDAKYTADFKYIEKGHEVIEEVKGFVVRDYPLRRAIIEHIYGFKIRETK